MNRRAGQGARRWRTYRHVEIDPVGTAYSELLVARVRSSAALNGFANMLQNMKSELAAR